MRARTCVCVFVRAQEPGRPLFVSLLLYLDREWRREWDAETLFLDTPSDTGIVVRPKVKLAACLPRTCITYIMYVGVPTVWECSTALQCPGAIPGAPWQPSS